MWEHKTLCVTRVCRLGNAWGWMGNLVVGNSSG